MPNNPPWAVSILGSSGILTCTARQTAQIKVTFPGNTSRVALQWRHYEPDGVSNHRRLGCLLNRLFRRRSKKTSKFSVTGLCEGNSPVTGEFPTRRASNAENVSIWWRHHGCNFHSSETPGVMCTTGYPPKIHLKLKSREISFVDLKFNYRFHSRGTYSSAYHDCMLFNNPNSHRTVESLVMTCSENGRDLFQANLNSLSFCKFRGLWSNE